MAASEAQVNNMAKRILLSGPGGFVGAHTLIHILHNTEWEVVGIDSFRHKGKTDRVTEVLHKSHPEYLDRVTILTHDLTVPFSHQFVNEIGHVDYVINMASESHVDRSITHPRSFVENNVALQLTMLEYVRENPVEKFLQVSTDEVFGAAPAGYDHKEGEPHLPSNPYAASKAMQEDLLFSYWRTYGIPVILTNTMNIIGEMQDPEKLMPKTIVKAFSGEVMPIFSDGTGTVLGTRKYLHARNQADALVFLLDSYKPDTYGPSEDISRFNVVGEKELNNLEMAQLIAGFVGKKLNYELVNFHESRPGHDMRYSLDGSRLASLGWKAPVPLEESIESTVKWTLDNPQWMLP
jgi:dTDP-glucose 4,6-dehydratase